MIIMLYVCYNSNWLIDHLMNATNVDVERYTSMITRDKEILIWESAFFEVIIIYSWGEYYTHLFVLL